MTIVPLIGIIVNTKNSLPRAKKLFSGQTLLLCLFLILVFLLLFSRVMITELNHDEYQFVAGGQLFADRGLFPYRDYPFLHMPYMIFFNALLFKLTGYDFLVARLLTAICGILSAGLLYLNIFRSTVGNSKTFRSILGYAAVLLFVINIAYTDANGRALNHAIPNLLSLLALEVFFWSLKSRHPGLLLFFIGTLTGLATGTRLTYALLIPAFACAILVTPLLSSTAQKIDWLRIGLRKLFFFGSGISIALLPVLLLALSAPRQFLFGNFVYIRLNTGYREAMGYAEAMTSSSKLIYFAEKILIDPVSGLLYALALAFSIFSIWKLIHKKDEQSAINLLVALLSFFMFLSAFGPTPTWPQYFFAPLPFLVIAGASIIGLVYQKYPRLGWGLTGLILLLAVINGSISQASSDLKHLQDPEIWVPLQIHQFSVEIKQALPEGKVLTLAPIFPLEAGLDTYEMFAVGPLVWRSAHILSAEKRQEYGIIAYTDLDQYLENQPPDAFLLGVEDRYDGFWIYNPGGLEVPLQEYAEAHGYHPVELSPGFGEDDEVLWVK